MQAERTLLLVDDCDVLYRPGTKRVLHPLTRHRRNPVIEEDRPWEVTVAYCSVYRNPESGGYQMWYQAWHPGQDIRVCYAESQDGIRWVKPSLGICSFQGNGDTNIVMDDGHRFGASVIVDERDPDPSRRHKMVYWRRGLRVAFSPDGIHWTMPFEAPRLPGSGGHPGQPSYVDEVSDRGGTHYVPMSVSDVVDVAWDPKRDVFMVYAKVWMDGPKGDMFWKRAVVRTESVDFVHWSKPQLVIAPDEFDGQGGDHELERTTVGGGSGGTQLHSGPVFFHNEVYFSLLQVLAPGSTGYMPTELAISRDGYRWQRPFRKQMFIPVTGRDEFDGSLIWSNSTPVLLDDEFRFYYGAYSYPWNTDDRTQISGIGLASMPRDRFAGVRPIEQFGQITLKPIPLDGVAGLSLNADASAGAVRVEVLSHDGYRVRGYTKDDAIPIAQDGLRQPVRWQERRIADLPEGKYMLRLHLDRAEVYAVTLSK
jgi:hypothetical protein